MNLRWLPFCLICGLALERPAPAAVMYVKDTITVDQTWSDTVICSTAVVVIVNAVVTVQPGAYVRRGPTAESDIKIKDGGVLDAVGTADQRIRFYDIRLIYEALTRDSLNRLQYCLLENNYCMLETRNPAGVTEQSELVIDNCEFRNGGYTCIYLTSGGSAAISRSKFSNANSGIFIHGGEHITVTYTTIHNVGCGIIHGTMPDWYEEVWLDHCTIYAVDSIRGYTWSRGHGIVCLNDPPGYLEVRNSIISTTYKYAVMDQNYYLPKPDSFPPFDIDLDYNCYYRNAFGITDDNFDIGPHCLEANPLFADTTNDDFSLLASSPCRSSANDGTHRGAWQENYAPRITSAPDTTAAEDTVYTYQVRAADYDSLDTLIFSLTAGPSGLAIDSLTGLVTWLPGQADVGTTTVTVKVRDNHNAWHSQTFTVAVQNVNDLPQITSAAVDTAAEEAPYLYVAAAADSDGDPLTFSFSGLPAWLAAVAETLSGTPPLGAHGDAPFTVIASDGELADTLVVQLVVKDADGYVPVVLSSFTARSVSRGVWLTWATQSEMGNLGFNVLRGTAVDGDFVRVNAALVPGAGTTVLPRSYSYIDADATAGTWSYQLEQVDINGRRVYSDVVAVTVPATAIPAATYAGVPSCAARRLVLHDLSGRQIHRTNAQPGIYLVQQDGVWRKILVTE